VQPNAYRLGNSHVQYPVKNISFVEFFGSPGGAVPDGGTTVILLGAALAVLAAAWRFMTR
jgi:protein with PEP-CTERM/exosortase system signal